jgi:hypothetical protein
MRGHKINIAVELESLELFLTTPMSHEEIYSISATDGYWKIKFKALPNKFTTDDDYRYMNLRDRSTIVFTDHERLAHKMITELMLNTPLNRVGSLMFKSILIHLPSHYYRQEMQIEGNGYHSSVEYEKTDFKMQIKIPPEVDPVIDAVLNYVS